MQAGQKVVRTAAFLTVAQLSEVQCDRRPSRCQAICDTVALLDGEPCEAGERHRRGILAECPRQTLILHCLIKFTHMIRVPPDKTEIYDLE